MYVKGTNAFFLERACVSSMPFAIDDLQKQTSRNTSVHVSDLIIDLYNGTKTTAGSLTSSMYVKGTNAFFLERACVSSMPFAIDDLQKQTSRNTSFNDSNLIIDLSNGAKTTNLHKGSLNPSQLHWWLPTMISRVMISTVYILIIVVLVCIILLLLYEMGLAINSWYY